MVGKDDQTACSIWEEMQSLWCRGGAWPPHRLALHCGIEHESGEGAVRTVWSVVVGHPTDRHACRARLVGIEQLLFHSCSSHTLATGCSTRQAFEEWSTNRAVHVEVVGHHQLGSGLARSSDDVRRQPGELFGPSVVSRLCGVEHHRGVGTCAAGAFKSGEICRHDFGLGRYIRCVARHGPRAATLADELGGERMADAA